MMKCQQFLIVFALVVIQGHHGWARYFQKSKPLDFDMYLLTQTWLPTFCKTSKRFDLSHFCSKADSYDRWSIHGLWPEKRNGPTPENCADTPLSNEKIATMISELKHNWVDVFAVNRDKPHEMKDFWEREWKKHGTCAFKPNDKTAQFDYFKKSLYLFKQYNVGNILQRANIERGKKYNYLELTRILREQVGTECQIACHKEEDPKRIDESPTEQYLKEIRICFGRDLKPVDCGRSKTSLCRRDSKILYVDPSPSNNRASASTGPNQMNPPADSAPKTNPSGFGPRDFSFGIGLQGPAAFSGP